MKKTRDTFYTTAQGRLPRDLTSQQCQALDAYGDFFSQVERNYIAAVSREIPVHKNDWLTAFGITGRQFNAVKRSAEGKIDSQLNNLDNYLNKLSIKLQQLQEASIELKGKAERIKSQPESDAKNEVLDATYSALHKVHSGQQHAKNRFDDFSRQRLAQRPSICLGSRKLFKAQFNLDANGYGDHREWKDRWQSSRRTQFFVLGAKNEKMGCQGCMMTLEDDGTLALRIRMPNGLQEAHGKYLFIKAIQIGYQPELIEMASAKNLQRLEMTRALDRRVKPINAAIKRRNKKYPHFTPKSLISIDKILGNEGIAVNYRFVRDDKGWRILISLAKPDMPKVDTHSANGAIGIDLNADHLAISEIDHQGNLVRSWSVPLPTEVNASSRQNRTAIEAACKKIIALASKLGKSVFIEDLDFTFKKANLQKGNNARYNKMLSTLSYRLFEQTIKRQGIQAGVEVKAVNPAYTSFIGRLKYINQTQGSVHEAAAMVIARRGKGHRDRLPKESRQTFRREARTFSLPEDRGKDGYACYKKAKKTFDKWHTDQILDLRRIESQERNIRQMEAELSF